MTRILLVEDEPSIAMGLGDDLQAEGFEVAVVGDGATAERRILAREHDLVLLDVMLPRKDGFAVCRSVRAAGVRTPIILLTAKGQEADKVLGLDIGADDYVTKPFSYAELLARVRAVLRRAGDDESGPKAWERGDLRVDFVRGEATRRGKPVALTATEFRMLRVFCRYPGQVLTIDQLLARVWGPGVFLTDRVVYTHVNNLRSKIEPEPSRPRFVISVRGQGYRFDG